MDSVMLQEAKIVSKSNFYNMSKIFLSVSLQ